MRCGIYVRVSTDDQRDNGYSIDSQLRMLKEYADKNNYNIVGIYNDAGYSGKNLMRPEMQRLLKEDKNITIIEDMVEDLIVVDNTIVGVKLAEGKEINAKSVILTTGTYMKADILVGDTRTRQGPHGEKPSMHLSDKLESYGFEILRLKTGDKAALDKGEFFDEGLRREVKEETGLDIKILGFFEAVEDNFTACKNHEVIKSVNVGMHSVL